MEDEKDKAIMPAATPAGEHQSPKAPGVLATERVYHPHGVSGKESASTAPAPLRMAGESDEDYAKRIEAAEPKLAPAIMPIDPKNNEPSENF